MRKFRNFNKAENAIVKILGRENVLTDEISLALNSFDGSPGKNMPDAVLNIADAAKLPALIKILNKYNVPFVPRSAATNHDGAAVPVKGGAVLNLSALKKIILIDTENGYAVAEPGLINKTLQDALAPLGFFYAPDPASMHVSTVGGNSALNAGGPKTLKYGSTAANILSAEIVTPAGETLTLSKSDGGPDLLSLLTRSEGTLGIITKLKLKIMPMPQNLKTIKAYFPSLDETMNAVREIIAAGILPSALEAMDKTTMDVTKTAYPRGMEAMIIIELDSPQKTIEAEAKKVKEILKDNNAGEIEEALSPLHRTELWAKRKAAASSLVKLAPNLISLDSAFPRDILPKAITGIRDIFYKYNIRGGMVFHAGDGNVHPNIVFDETNLFESRQVQKAVKEIHALTVALGGSISGEHGIGIEKRAAMAFMFDAEALNLFKKIKKALDPGNIANPDKIIPIATTKNGPPVTPPDYLNDIINKLKQSYKNSSRLTITGLETKLKTKAKNILSTKSLDKIIDIDKSNYTVTAQAGIPLKDLEKKLAEHKMYLPFQSVKGSAGGVYASKIFENMADYITGIDFLLADGTFISAGGKHVKNSAGYDLIRFLHGSMGAYALVTALTIRTFAAKQPHMEERPFKNFEPSALAAELKNVFDDKNILGPQGRPEEQK